MHVVLTHENADFDAIASLLGVAKLHPEAVPVLPSRLNSNVAAFIALYASALPFVTREHWRRRKIKHLTIVDTQKAQSVKGIEDDTPIDYIDHHTPTVELKPGDKLTCENVGATTTLLVERMIEKHVALNSLEATLLALGIYEDTGSFTYGRTTVRDLQAATWLLGAGAALDTVRRFLSIPLNDEQQALLDLLLIQAEHRTIQGYTVVISATQVDKSIAEISRVAHRLGELLDPAAMLTVVQTPSGTHLILRSATDEIDVAEVARIFGGGGHPRAAAATLANVELTSLVADLWAQVGRVARPAVRVAQLMSYGVHTVNADVAIGDLIVTLRRIGHEGYPVVDEGRVVGLLTRRDADRAVEHGLGRLHVREIMQSGTTTLTPDASVDTMETLIMESGWGQIPVLDSEGKLLGIVTRTDLIKHWAQSHPHLTRTEIDLTLAQIETIQGAAVARLIDQIADIAKKGAISIYMVGGCVRDLLLQRRNLDLDFVVEGDAIAFAKLIRDKLGGHISSFPPFGTAKWSPDVETLRHLDVANLPDHVDFASARNEFYEHPTALPTVYTGSIKLDLLRRDFTINTLAVQIAPHFGRVIDFYGGLQDLQSRLIRVLHSLSFIDDPTRILRAVRFEQRLGFAIEPRSAALIESGLPMLGRITGERVRAELELLFREEQPEAGLKRLKSLGALREIHPALDMPLSTLTLLGELRMIEPTEADLHPRIPDDIWYMIAASIRPEEVAQLCDRLLISGSLRTVMIQTADLFQRAMNLETLKLPSDAVAFLDTYDERAVRVLYATGTHVMIRDIVRRYLREWRHIQPATTGHTLIALGLKPGPCFQKILSRLRDGLLNNEFLHDEESTHVQQWLVEGICDDNLP